MDIGRNCLGKACLKAGATTSLLLILVLAGKGHSYHGPNKKVLRSTGWSNKTLPCSSTSPVAYKLEAARVDICALKWPTGNLSQISPVLRRIRSHPLYIGHVDQFRPTYKSGIYEFCDAAGALHFYLQQPKGLRHFSMARSTPGGKFSKIENGSLEAHYPSLEKFLKCAWSI